mmetsp:Transcript_1791/g.2841  ORF Transcript_1791/g.2841 Transcript_1791/m.2841 type:complete len:205 (-) Transcript_1791:144-758(-)
MMNRHSIPFNHSIQFTTASMIIQHCTLLKTATTKVLCQHYSRMKANLSSLITTLVANTCLNWMMNRHSTPFNHSIQYTLEEAPMISQHCILSHPRLRSQSVFRLLGPLSSIITLALRKNLLWCVPHRLCLNRHLQLLNIHSMDKDVKLRPNYLGDLISQLASGFWSLQYFLPCYPWPCSFPNIIARTFRINSTHMVWTKLLLKR